MLEVLLVNVVSPFTLVRELLPSLESAQGAFVVNVTSPEGSFHQPKAGTHPHANMAKAALNMFTKTVAHDLATRHVFLTAVDTGWVTAMRRSSTVPPLSEED